MAPTKVAVAGATGNIGIPIINALIAASHDIVALTRKGSSSTSKLPKSPNLTIKEVDYTSVSDLKAALEGVKVVVSAVATASIGDQEPLINAAVAAGVERFLPSEFGSDSANPVSSKLPGVFKGKVATQNSLKAKVAQNPNFSYTLLMTGPFLDWGLDHGFFLAPKTHSATLLNGGDVKFSATTVKTIAQAVVGIIAHLAETKNRAVYVHDTVTTQNRLIGYAKEKDGKEWDLIPKTTQAVYDESMKVLQDGGDVGKVAIGFILYSVFGGEKTGGSFEGRDDNALLGLKPFGEEQVKAVVQSLV